MHEFFLIANFRNVLQHTFSLKGRSTRRELLGFIALPWIVYIAAALILAIIGALGADQSKKFVSVQLFAALLFFSSLLVLFIPFFSLGVRRLHDVGFSGKWLLWWCIINPIPLFMACSALACGEPFMAFMAFMAPVPLFVWIFEFLLPANVAAGVALALSLIYLFTNFIISFVLIVLLLTSGDKGKNRYGAPSSFSTNQIS